MSTLNDVATFLSGFAWKSARFNSYSDGVPLIRIQNVAEPDQPLVYWPDEYDRRFLVERGDILMSMSGNVKLAYWHGDSALLNQRIVKITPREGVSKSWLYHVIKARIDEIASMAKHAVIANVSIGDIKAIPLSIPPLEEQKRIAAILDKADSLRRKRAQAIALADDFLRATFLDMFGDPVTNPKGWPTKPLGDLCRIRRGGSPRPISEFIGGTIPWIKIGDASSDGSIYVESTKEAIIEAGLKKTVLLEPGAMIFANCGVSLGFARILKIQGCIHDGWLAFDQFSDELNQVFLLNLINLTTDYLRSIAPDGTQPNLNTKIMSKFDVILPPLDLQKKLVIIMNKKNKFLKELRRSESSLLNLNSSLSAR